MKEGTIFIAFRMDEWQAAALTAIAKEDQRSRNSLMRVIITDYIKKRLDPVQLDAFQKINDPS